MTDCIFCKIISHEIPSELVEETQSLVVFKDHNPKAPVHLLIVPKKHVESIAYLEDIDKELISSMIYAAKETAARQGLLGYRLSINVGRDGGQIVDHLHLHLLGGWVNGDSI